MLEFSIIMNDNRVEEARHICRELKKHTQEFGVKIKTISENNKIFITLSCEKHEFPRLHFFACDAIADVISIFYKLEFIEKNLKLHINQPVYLNAFKKALVAFDRDTDKYLITHNLKIENSIFLDSFYTFRLKSLQNKWKELIKLANENASYLLCSDTFIDLLKFLIENIEVSSGLVNIIKTQEDFLICDEKFNQIDTKEEGLCLLKNYNNTQNEAEVDLITSLIALSPKKINVYCDQDENNTTLTLISELFGSRVCILPKTYNEFNM